MFPVYLKYKKHDTYFKINSFVNFEELRIIGDFFNISNFNAKILPDRVFIADLLEDKGHRMERISSREYEDTLELCYRHKRQKSFWINSTH